VIELALFNKRELILKANSELNKSIFNESASTILKSAASQDDKKYDIFLSHSYSDAKVVLGLKKSIEELGYSVYVDWIEDRQLNRQEVTKETAHILRMRMRNCSSLFFATSDSSQNSKWMPWELGYFDGIKEKVAILPVTETSEAGDNYSGQEYLGLYNYATKDPDKSGENHIWIHESPKVYVQLNLWLKGHKPRVHQ
jgi:hypothetical protein